jgi:thiazole synthase
MNDPNPLIIDNKLLNSRLFLGTGKFPSSAIMQQALEASHSQVVTMALRRVNLETEQQDDLRAHLDPQKYIYLPNTSGARNAAEAVRIAKIAKAFGLSNWIKLEVTPEPNYLLPDPIETLKAAEELVKLGFVVLPYINADPILAKRLEEVGTATVMPLAAPIGSNQGLRTKELLQIIIEQARVPVVIDAGLGAPSDACQAMELGADAVLVNTAIATANNPILMAEAFKAAVEAGRNAYLAGLATKSANANASSPLTAFFTC